jgi:hypothetical protein
VSFAWLVLWLGCTCVDGAWRPPIAGAALCAALGAGVLALRAALVRRATHHLDPYASVRR